MDWGLGWGRVEVRMIVNGWMRSGRAAVGRRGTPGVRPGKAMSTRIIIKPHRKGGRVGRQSKRKKRGGEICSFDEANLPPTCSHFCQSTRGMQCDRVPHCRARGNYCDRVMFGNGTCMLALEAGGAGCSMGISTEVVKAQNEACKHKCEQDKKSNRKCT